MRGQRWFSKAAVGKFLTTVEAQTHFTASRPEIIVTLTKIVPRVGQNMSAVIEAVINGKIKGYRSTHRLERINDIWFEQQTVEDYIEQAKFQSGLLFFKDVYKMLHISDELLRHLETIKLLCPIEKTPRGSLYRIMDVDAFKERIVNVCEVAKFLNLSETTIRNWTKAGHIEAIIGPSIDGHGHYLYDKNYIEKWSRSHIGSSQVAQILNVSRRTLYNWMAKGYIAPKFHKNKRLWFSMDDVEQLQASGITKKR
jgi:DNA-binding transcriptional MerR regulator